MDFCRDTQNNSCQDVTMSSFQVVHQRLENCNSRINIWSRHSDCRQLCLSYAENCDHDSTWSSIISRNGLLIDSVCVRNLVWSCGLTTNSVEDCKLLAFDRCVTICLQCQDCMYQIQNDVCRLLAWMLISAVGLTVWGIAGFFHILAWICAQLILFMSYQLRVYCLLKLMFAGNIVFFRWFAVSKKTQEQCNTITHVRSISAKNAQHCYPCQRCQTSISRLFLLIQFSAAHCIDFRIKVQQSNIVVTMDQIHVPNITWWINLPKDYPIGEASNPGPE